MRKPGSTRESFHSVRSIRPGAGQQDEGDRDLRHDEEVADFAAGRSPSPRSRGLPSGRTTRLRRGRQGRDQAQADPRQDGDAEREEEHRAVDRDLGRPRREALGEVHEQSPSGHGDEQAQRAAHERERARSRSGAAASAARGPRRGPSAAPSPSRAAPGGRARGSRRWRRPAAGRDPPCRTAGETWAGLRASAPRSSGTGEIERRMDEG